MSTNRDSDEMSAIDTEVNIDQYRTDDESLLDTTYNTIFMLTVFYKHIVNIILFALLDVLHFSFLI